MAKKFNTLAEKMPPEVRERAEIKARAMAKAQEGIWEEIVPAKELATQTDLPRIKTKTE